MRASYKTFIHGFEDYSIVHLMDYCFYRVDDFYVPHNFFTAPYSYLITKNLLVKIDHNYYGVTFNPSICENHKELLSTVKKVYIHQNCGLSRSMLAEKYKKSLNPWLSDIVVVPKFDCRSLALYRVALFINENAKMIVLINLTNDDAIIRASKFNEGDKFDDCTFGCIEKRYHCQFNPQDVLDAEFFYYGELLSVPNNYSYIADILTGNIPSDRIVYEDSLQDTLSSESNQLSFDSLCSIKDMLESSDDDTVSAGFKALSMMDWMHYPESIKLTLKSVDNRNNWAYNKAVNSTSVKYMLKTISNTQSIRRHFMPGNYSNSIYEKDYELFKKLKCHYDHIQEDDVITKMVYMNFMHCDANGVLKPSIKPMN